jgi:hypothetical protein
VPTDTRQARRAMSKSTNAGMLPPECCRRNATRAPGRSPDGAQVDCDPARRRRPATAKRQLQSDIFKATDSRRQPRKATASKTERQPRGDAPRGDAPTGLPGRAFIGEYLKRQLPDEATVSRQSLTFSLRHRISLRHQRLSTGSFSRQNLSAARAFCSESFLHRRAFCGASFPAIKPRLIPRSQTEVSPAKTRPTQGG